MRVIAKRTLREFWQSSPQYADAQGPIEAWHAETLKASWRNPQEVKAQFRSASVLKGSRLVFNIGGNKYRLVVAVDYARETCFVKFIGTHEQYDSIDAETVQHEGPSDSI
jgi:mRNA interferase HigB